MVCGKKTRHVGSGGSWWYDKVKRMLISRSSAGNKGEQLDGSYLTIYSYHGSVTVMLHQLKWLPLAKKTSKT